MKKKINIIDIAIVVIIVLAIAVVAIKVLGSKVTDAVSEKVDCYAEVVIVGAQPRIFNEALRQNLIGEKMVSGNEYLSSTIEDMWLEDYVIQVENSDGVTVNSTDPTCKNLVVLVKTQIAADTASPKIGSQELRAGKTFIVKTQTFETSGIIRYVNIGSYESPYEAERQAYKASVK